MLLLDGTSKYRLSSPHSISSSGNITKSDNKVFHSLRKSLFLEEGKRYMEHSINCFLCNDTLQVRYSRRVVRHLSQSLPRLTHLYRLFRHHRPFDLCVLDVVVYNQVGGIPILMFHHSRFLAKFHKEIICLNYCL